MGVPDSLRQREPRFFPALCLPPPLAGTLCSAMTLLDQSRPRVQAGGGGALLVSNLAKVHLSCRVWLTLCHVALADFCSLCLSCHLSASPLASDHTRLCPLPSLKLMAALCTLKSGVRLELSTRQRLVREPWTTCPGCCGERGRGCMGSGTRLSRFERAHF